MSVLERAVCAALSVSLLLGAQSQAPLGKVEVYRMLEERSVSNEAVAAKIRTQGVAFRFSPEVLARCRELGASDDVVRALQQSYRALDGGSVQSEAPMLEAAEPGQPFTRSELLEALHAGVSKEKLAGQIQRRGVAFALTSEIARELQAAGGNAELVGQVALHSRTTGEQTAAPLNPAPAIGLPEEFKPFPSREALDFDPYSNAGRFDLRMHVDGAVEVEIQGNSVFYRVLSGQPARNAGTEYTQAIPSRELSAFEVEKKDGRGKYAVLEKPAAENEYRFRVRIYDEKGGPDRYHLRLTWH